jgi:hypothetical protein
MINNKKCITGELAAVTPVDPTHCGQAWLSSSTAVLKHQKQAALHGNAF